jgi:glutamine synthetase
LSPEEKTELKLNVVGKIPEILLDNTDRNRTSPFAFTGNKFEFRAVGSSANCAIPMTVLNSIVAKQLSEFKKEVDALIEERDLKKDEAIFNVLREYIKSSKDIIFGGNGYSQEWADEAERRGLSNHKTTPVALKADIAEKTISLYEELEVMNRIEIVARHEIKLEEYTKKIQIESRVLGDISLNHVIPTAINYQNILIKNVTGLKDVFGEEFKSVGKEQLDLIKNISKHISVITRSVNEMVEERKKANVLEHAEEMAIAYCDKVKPFFDIIRYHCDKLEMMVDDELWPLTKYREMLFTR